MVIYNIVTQLEEHSDSADKLSSNKYKFGHIWIVTLAYAKNVAMATMMINFNRAYIELFNGASHNYLSQIKVEQFKRLFLDFGCDPVIYQKCCHGNHDD